MMQVNIFRMQMLGGSVQNVVTYLTWHMEFLYPWCRLTWTGSHCWLPWDFVSILQIVWCKWRCSDGSYKEEVDPVCFWCGVSQEFGSRMSFCILKQGIS